MLLSKLFISSSVLFAAQYKNIEDHINKNTKNKLNYSYVKELSKNIVDLSTKYGINPKLYSAILMQESTYNLSAKNCKKRCYDYGISQINIFNIKKHNFSKVKLLNNLEYSVESGLIILSWFKKIYSKKYPKTWWSKYNCGTSKKQKILKKCNKYIKLVSRYL